MTKAIAYARVSTEDQSRGWSLPTQLEAIREFAARCGLEVIAEFTDSETGTKLERTNFTQVRDLLRNGAAQALIVYSLDRLSRNLVNSLILRDELEQQGVQLFFAKSGRAAGTNAEERAFDNIEATFAEMERAAFLERTARGRKGKIARGQYLGNGQPPYGYRVEGERRATRLVIHEEEANVVRTIFQLFAYGDETGRLSVMDIGRRLTQLGIPTPADTKLGFGMVKKRGFVEWHGNSIYPLLQRSAYVGHYVHGSYRRVNRKLFRSKEGLTTISVPAIIDEATWTAVQRRLQEGKERSPRRMKHNYLVARRIKCVCGYHLIGQPTINPRYPKPYLYYGCGGKQAGNVPKCSMRQIPVETLDAIVWQWMKEILMNPEELEAELREQSAHAAEKRAALDAELERLYGRKVEINNELQRLLALYMRGTFSEEVLDTEAAQKNMVLKAIETEIANVEAQRQTPLTEERIEALRTFAQELQRGIAEAEESFEARRRLVEMMDVRVEMVWKDKGLFLKITSDLGEGLLRFESKYSSKRSTRTPENISSGQKTPVHATSGELIRR